MSTRESPETDREATRASPIAADVGPMAPRSGEGHDQGYRFAFSLTSRASVVLRSCETRDLVQALAQGSQGIGIEVDDRLEIAEQTEV